MPYIKGLGPNVWEKKIFKFFHWKTGKRHGGAIFRPGVKIWEIFVEDDKAKQHAT